MAGSRYRHVRPLSPMSRKMKRLVDHERLPDSGSTARLAKKLSATREERGGSVFHGKRRNLGIAKRNGNATGGTSTINSTERRSLIDS